MQKRIISLKILFSIILSSMITNGYTLTCDIAKKNLMQATSQVRANHLGEDSFNLYGQNQLIRKDDLILKENNYLDSLSFFNSNCKKGAI